MITLDILREVSDGSVKDSVLNELIDSFNTYLPKYKIDTPLRYCAFLSQCSHETGGFQFFHELGSKKYFSKYEPGTKIGNVLGNINPGDGYKYRGRGIFMLTGRSNYQRYSKVILKDLIGDPDQAASIPCAVLIACEFWDRKKLSPLADAKKISAITRMINGGYNGLEERKRLYNKLIRNLNS